MVRDDLDEKGFIRNYADREEIIRSIHRVSKLVEDKTRHFNQVVDLDPYSIGQNIAYAVAAAIDTGKMDEDVKIIIKKILRTGSSQEKETVLAHLIHARQSVKFARYEIFANLHSREPGIHFRILRLLPRLFPLPQKTLDRLCRLLENEQTPGSEIIVIADILRCVRPDASFSASSLIRAVSHMGGETRPVFIKKILDALLNAIYMVGNSAPEHKQALLAAAKPKDRFVKKYIEIFVEEKM